MPILNLIAYFQDRRDEVPNVELAKQLAEKKDKKGIREIAENLWNENPAVQADCVKVLYEIGYRKPELIADYADDFLKLLKSKNNRLVWGGMTALGTIAALKADFILKHRVEVITAIENGSVITVDNGIQTLALAAAQGDKYRKVLFRFLFKHLATCRPKDVPQHAEKTLTAVSAKNQAEFVAVLERRMRDMTGSQAARVKKAIKEAAKR